VQAAFISRPRGETLKANRSNLPYLIAAAGGALLVLSLFLAWFSVDGGSASLWEVASGIDIVLALLGIAAAAIAGARVAGGALPAPPEALKWIGVVATTIVLAYVIESDNLGIGAFLGLLAALAILAGAILGERPDLASRVADAAGIDDRPAAPPPAGVGPGSSTATPSAASTPPAPPASSAAPSPGGGPAASVQRGTGGGAATPATPPSAGAGAAGGGPAASSGPPPGWYPDPQGQARLRYWDGAGWTDQTSA
jgi:Protein of unknown function (DUF2510)